MAILLKKFGSNTPPLPSPFPLSSRREWQEKRGRGVWPRPNRPDGESGRVGELLVLVDIIGRIARRLGIDGVGHFVIAFIVHRFGARVLEALGASDSRKRLFLAVPLETGTTTLRE